jgi:large subunit ribosomal protein L21
MYAVVEIGGRQFKVVANDKIEVPSLPGKAGETLQFEKILLVGDDQGVTVGHPLVRNVSVQGKILDHGLSEKIIVFKKKRRKGYRVTRGHRQGYTQIEITSIGK